MNGDTITEKGYSAEALTADAINWLENRDKNKPFAFFFHHKAPHRNFVPALKYLEEYHTKTFPEPATLYTCLLYTSDAADERSSVDLGGRRIIKKKQHKTKKKR